MDINSLAEESKEAYQEYEMGSKPSVHKRLLSKFESGDRDDLDDFLKVKGPYQSHLGLTKWGDKKWEDFAEDENLEDSIIEAFSEFDKLMAHQEDAVREITKGENTLISASTGTGKTEAWFIPLLNKIIKEKREEDEQRTKSLIIYPTKALAQDQYQRFIGYLGKVNQQLKEDITIGIYDGDTPSGSSSEALEKIQNSFSHIDNPFGESGKLVPEPAPEATGFRLLAKEDPENSTGEPVDFVYLTKDRIEKENPDIILTNPDTINYRLIDINDSKTLDTFVKQPSTVIFDEIHLYKGQFGANTSMILRRMENIKSAEDEQFQYIASSATVDNGEEIFSRIFDVSNDEQVTVEEEELGYEVDWSNISNIPDYLLNSEIDSQKLGEGITEDRPDINTQQILEDLNAYEGSFSGNEVKYNLSKILVENNSDLAHHLLHYHELSKENIEKSQISAAYQDNLRLDEDEASKLIKNLEAVLDALEMIETRKHLFMWPLDGIYSCIKCGAVYNDPKEECQKEDCDSEFITKLNTCNVCGKEVYEGWYCPLDNEVMPTKVSEEGRLQYYNRPDCSEDEEHHLYRLYWTPYFECSGCGKIEPQDNLSQCNNCGAPTEPSESGYKCINPECGQEQSVSGSCSCGGDMVFKGNPEFKCTNCGTETDHRQCDNCEDGDIVTKIPLMWRCRNPDCGKVYENKPEGTCESCNARSFGITGLIDVTEFDQCSSCGNKYIKGETCDSDECEDAEMQPKWKNLGMRVIDADGRLRQPTNYRNSAPCYHKRKTNSNTYSPIMYGPAHRAVTYSQVLLRQLRKENSAKDTKLLSFSDSYRDVEELIRNFIEPEREFYFYQLVMRNLEQEGELTLEELQENVIEQINSAFEDDNTVEDFKYNLLGGGKDEEQENKLREYLKGIIIGGQRLSLHERGSTRYPSGGKMRRKEGLVACELDIDSDLSEEEKDAISSVLNTPQKQTTLESNFSQEVVRGLKQEGVFSYDGNTLDIASENIVCYHPGSHGISWNPESTQYYDKLDVQIGESNGGVNLTEDYEERAEYENARFNRNALIYELSDPFFHISDAYRGDNDPSERRSKEEKFKEYPFPNFLSSTSALEVGLDIGDLNHLMLYGIPPNINSYLQRVGRVGRKEGKSLVTSISKRNPIDYYYYHNPEELIVGSEEQPVPVNEDNSYALESHLTWAILDYINENYQVRWRRGSHQGQDIIKVLDNGYNHKDQHEEYNSPEKTFNEVYHAPLRKLMDIEVLIDEQKDKDEIGYKNAMRVLGQLVSEKQEEIEDWLTQLIDYNYCEDCGTRYEAEELVGRKCEKESCDGIIQNRAEENSELIAKAIENFETRIYKFVEDEISTWNQELEEAYQNHNTDRISDISDIKDNLSAKKLADAHKNSSKSRFHFNIRTNDESIEIKRDTGDKKESFNTRDIKMALKDLHPYALYRYNGTEYVVTQAEFDKEKKQEIVRDTDLEEEVMVCPIHGDQGNSDTCNVDGCTEETQVVEPKVLKSVNVKYANSKVSGGDGKVSAKDIYSLSESSDTQSTFPKIERKISQDAFSKKKAIKLQSGDETIGKIEYGKATVENVNKGFKAKYKGGVTDPDWQPIEICRNCNSIISKRQGEGNVCTSDSSHSGTKKIWPIYRYQTNAIRIKVRDDKVAHTLSHGLRTALQKIAGAEPREIGEITEDNDEESKEFFLFESETGGNGILELLFRRSGEKDEIEKAAEVIVNTLDDCGCEKRDGCPKCTYQRNCYERNDNLLKEKTKERLKNVSFIKE
jgi:ATP-dependent helicase YprA (DUF1998 family)